MRLQAHVGCFPRGFGGQVLGHVGFCAARLAGIKQLARLEAHQVGGFGFNVGVGNRELHALVLADGAVEHHAVAGVAARLVNKPVGVANAFGGNQRALGVQPVQDVFEALAFLADQVFSRNFQVVKKHFVGFVVHHVGNRPHRHAVADGVFQVDDKNRHAFRLLFHFGQRRGAGQQNHQV